MNEPGRFLIGSTMGHVVRMALTGMIGFVIIFAVDAMNLYWLSRTGETRLIAAAGFAFAIQFMAVGTCIGLMVAATALVSRSIGDGDAPLARQQATSAVLIALAFQAVIMVVFLIYRHSILDRLGAGDEVAALAARYLAMSLPTLPVMGAAMVLNGVLRAEGDARRSVVVTLGGGLVSLMLDPVLIEVLGWGLDGAAISTNLKRVVVFALAFRFARKIHDLLARPAWADVAMTLRPFLWIAVPAMLSQLARPTGNYLLTMVMAPYGEDALAGWAVMSRVILVAFGGLFSLAAAIGGIFGQNLGGAQFDRVRSAYRDSIIFGIVYVLIAWAVLYAVTEPVIAAFGLVGDGAAMVRAFTHVGAGAFLLGTGLFVSNAAFNALGKPGWATAINWLRDGLLTWPFAMVAVGMFGAAGVIYSQVAVSLVMGTLAGALGFWYVRHLEPETAPKPSNAPMMPVD